MKPLGVVLILVTGLLTFHPPHFLLEAGRPNTPAAAALEIGLAINLPAAIVAAAAIWRDARWGWALGLLIAATAVGLYIAQQTIGLPGLPKDWLEPSRIVALAVEGSFITLSIRQLRHGHH